MVKYICWTWVYFLDQKCPPIRQNPIKLGFSPLKFLIEILKHERSEVSDLPWQYNIIMVMATTKSRPVSGVHHLLPPHSIGSRSAVCVTLMFLSVCCSGTELAGYFRDFLYTLWTHTELNSEDMENSSELVFWINGKVYLLNMGVFPRSKMPPN